jgi:hypothetical protein
MEARIAFSALLDRFSSIRLVSEPEYREQVVLRGVEELWVEVERDFTDGERRTPNLYAKSARAL